MDAPASFDNASLENQTPTLRMPALQVRFCIQEEEMLPWMRDAAPHRVRYRLRRRPQGSQVLLDVGFSQGKVDVRAGLGRAQARGGSEV